MPDISDLKLRIEVEYGIRVKDIFEFKDELLFSSSNNIYFLRKDKMKETDFISVGGLYEYLKANGFKNMLKAYCTIKGKYYIKSSNEYYMIFDHIDSEDFSIFNDGKLMARFLAKFHKCARGFMPPAGGRIKSYWGRWTEEYCKKYKDIKNFEEKMASIDKKTAADEAFLKSLGKYMERMQKSISMLKSDGYLDIVEESMKAHEVCIKSFKQSYFYKNESNINIKYLNKCGYDIYEKDISDFMCKIVESGMDDIKDLKELIYVYKCENFSRNYNKDIIRAFLLFPEQYVKVCCKYMKNNDKFAQEKYIEKLKCAEHIEDKKMELVDALN
ncbi:MAG: hypothetical protein QME45_00445 [Clostridiales bacterium]|nr:hypothetical protein [Clostridiales bacterium]HBM79798.1 hypothetical protein [Clostridiaceae bacterium]